MIHRPRNLGLWLAPVGAAAFTLTWLVLGFISSGYRIFNTTVRHYSAVAQPISGLGLSDTAPWMNTAFVVCGVLITLGVVATSRVLPPTTHVRQRRLGVGLIALIGVGSATCGLFDLRHMAMHSLGFMLAMGMPAIGFLLVGRTLRASDRVTSTWLYIAAPLTFGLFVIFLATFNTGAGGDNGVAGLVQRVLCVLAVGTAATLSWRARGYPAAAVSRSSGIVRSSLSAPARVLVGNDTDSEGR